LKLVGSEVGYKNNGRGLLDITEWCKNIKCLFTLPLCIVILETLNNSQDNPIPVIITASSNLNIVSINTKGTSEYWFINLK
jgi:hypothetical protein